MRSRCAGLLLTIFLAAIPAAASTIAVNFSNTTGQPLSNPPMTLGWGFQVNTPILVTWLSFFDSGQDGLAESHPLAIWNSGGDIMASATVGSGTAATLHDKFRAVPVSPVLLEPGTYRIGALFTSNLDTNIFPTFTAGFTTAPEITFLRGAAVVGSSLSNPTLTFFNMGPAYFGPNFEFQTVPEPASVSLVASVFIAGLVWRRRLASQRRQDSPDKRSCTAADCLS